MKHLYAVANRTPEPYKEDCVRFCHWLRTAMNSKMRYTFKPNLYKEETVEFPYVVRYTPSYALRVQAKFYALEKYYSARKIPITMITLTSYQVGKTSIKACGGRTIEEAFIALKKAINLIRKRLHAYLNGLQYIWVFEPHESGYPHVHLVVFGKVPEALQERLRRLYSQKWNIGSAEHGIDFREIDNVESVRNYVLKYINKSLNTSNSRYTKAFDWTPGQLVYYTLAQKYKWRFWGVTAGISDIMRYRPDNPNPYPVKLEIINTLASAIDEPCLVWQNPLSYGEYWAASMGGYDPPFDL